MGAKRVITVITLVGYLAGCTGWRNLRTFSPTPVPERSQFLRVTLDNGNRLELRDARIVGDSVIGQSPKPNQVRTAIALSHVRRIADRQVSEAATAAAIGGFLLGAMLVAGAAAASTINIGWGGN